MNDEPVLLTERKHGVLWLVLNRPASANALNEPLQDALVHELHAAEQNGDVRAVVLAAAGDRVFRGERASPRRHRVRQRGARSRSAIARRCPRPIYGPCICGEQATG